MKWLLSILILVTICASNRCVGPSCGKNNQLGKRKTKGKQTQKKQQSKGNGGRKNNQYKSAYDAPKYGGQDNRGYNQGKRGDYDTQNYNTQGYIKEYNNNGYDTQSYNTQGRNNNNGYKTQGYNQKGYNNKGYDAKGYNRNGYDTKGYNNNGYDAKGYDRKGYNTKGYNTKGYNNNGHDAKGYDKNGYDRKGYDRKGYNAKGYDTKGYDTKGYNDKGYDQKGSNKGYKANDKPYKKQEKYEKKDYDKDYEKDYEKDYDEYTEPNYNEYDKYDSDKTYDMSKNYGQGADYKSKSKYNKKYDATAYMPSSYDAYSGNSKSTGYDQNVNYASGYGKKGKKGPRCWTWLYSPKYPDSGEKGAYFDNDPPHVWASSIRNHGKLEATDYNGAGILNQGIGNDGYPVTNVNGGNYAWSPANNHNICGHGCEYWQFRLGPNYLRIAGFATEGRYKEDEFILSYDVSINDKYENMQLKKEFKGNVDEATIKLNWFDKLYEHVEDVKIYPRYYYGNWPSMRSALIIVSCDGDDLTELNDNGYPPPIPNPNKH